MADLTLTAAQIAPVFPQKATIISGVLSETVTVGQAVYLVASTGKWGLADANAAGKQQFRGIALGGGGANQAISILKEGHVYGYSLSGMNYDDIAYLSDTAGALADAAGTMEVVTGRVVPLTDQGNLTKVLYVDANWRTQWS